MFSQGEKPEPPGYIALVEGELLQRMSEANKGTAVLLRGLYGAWGLGARRQKDLRCRFGQRRGEAAVVMGEMGWREAGLEIAGLLRSRRAQIRLAALRALELVGLPEATAALVQALPVVKVSARLAAIAALASSCRSRPELLLPHLDHPDPEIRSLAAAAMARVAAPAVVKALKGYTEDPQEEVRAKIAKALGTTGDSLALPWLKRMTKDPGWAVRVQAVSALGELRGAEGQETLNTVLRDSDWRVRRAAAAAIYKLWDDPLWALTTLRHNENRFAREAVVTELERQGIIWEAVVGLGSLAPEKRARSRILVRELLRIGATTAIFYGLEMHPAEEVRGGLRRLLNNTSPEMGRVV